MRTALITKYSFQSFVTDMQINSNLFKSIELQRYKQYSKMQIFDLYIIYPKRRFP